MKNGRILGSLLFVLMIIIVASLVYYIYSSMMKGPEKQIVIEKLPPSVETKEPVFKEPITITKEKPEIFSGVIEEAPPLGVSDEEDYCTQIEKNIADFFNYLDAKPSIRLLGTGMDSFMHFKLILKKLTERPPVPAGEGVYPKIIIRNMYHFFRILNKSDIQLLKEILKIEKDSIETDLEMFYTWLTLYDRCPDKERIRPSLDVLYKYAGFFLNTMGGRAYLARRSANLRLLISYYSILIIHETDKNRVNNYGIDIVPFIAPLRSEISRYPEFEFQDIYNSKLNTIEGFYLAKR